MHSRSRSAALALTALVASGGALAPNTAEAVESRFGRYDVQTVFSIGKNVDRNEVHYGIRLDHDCLPYSEAPIYAYWRDLEKGPGVTSDLNMLDRTVYGIKTQSVTKRSPEEGKALMTIRATDRTIAILTHKRDGQCVAESIALINGAPARLDHVFVHVAGFLSVDWVEIRGTASGKRVVEHVKH